VNVRLPPQLGAERTSAGRGLNEYAPQIARCRPETHRRRFADHVSEFSSKRHRVLTAVHAQLVAAEILERLVLPPATLAGERCRTVATRFGVAVSSVVKWAQRHRATGSVAPARMGGRRKRMLEPHRAFIVERINQTSHLTLHGLKDELAARGVHVSHNSVWLFLRRKGLRFKKSH
jgi:transposase